jgi:diadenosine tetraphosphate (Ap4A) HIT family hydrolase
MNDSRYPWLLLVPRLPDIREFIDLDMTNRARIWREIEDVSEMMRREFSPHKLNVAALGNVVPQLHVHVIARSLDDAAWPRPVWGVGDRIPYEPEAGQVLAARLSAALGYL